MPLVWFPTLVLPLISFLPQFYPPTRHRSLSSTRTDGFRPSLTSGPHIFTQYIYCVVSLTSGTHENLPPIHFHSGHSRSDWIERGRQLGFQAGRRRRIPAGGRLAEPPHRTPLSRDSPPAAAPPPASPLRPERPRRLRCSARASRAPSSVSPRTSLQHRRPRLRGSPGLLASPGHPPLPDTESRRLPDIGPFPGARGFRAPPAASAPRVQAAPLAGLLACTGWNLP